MWSGPPRWMLSHPALPGSASSLIFGSCPSRKGSGTGVSSVWCLHQPGVSCVVSSRRRRDRLGGLGHTARRVSCWFAAKDWGQYGSPIPASDQEAQKLAASSGGVSMAAWASQRSSKVATEPSASLAQPASRSCALSQALVKIQGLCQMLTHSLRFFSL